MSEAATVVRYVDGSGTVHAETPAYELPAQSDWVDIDGEAYVVYDVVHTVCPDAERLTSTAFIWAPTDAATDADLNVYRDRAVAARAGEHEPSNLTFGDDGGAVSFVSVPSETGPPETHEHARVVASAIPSDGANTFGGVRIRGEDSAFVVSDVSACVDTAANTAETSVHLFEVDTPEKGAEMTSVRRVLNGQRSQYGETDE